MFFQLLELLFQLDNRLFEFQGVRLHRMVTGESLPTNEYNSSISSAEISMPDFGFCTFGLVGFGSEYIVILPVFSTIHRLHHKECFPPKATGVPADQASLPMILYCPGVTFAGR